MLSTLRTKSQGLFKAGRCLLLSAFTTSYNVVTTTEMEPRYTEPAGTASPATPRGNCRNSARNGQPLNTVSIGFTETVDACPANDQHVELFALPSQSRAAQRGTRRRGWEGRTRTLGASGPASRADVRSAPPPIVEAASSPSRGDVSAPSVGTPALFPREESPSLSACPNLSIFTHFSILIAALLASKQGFMKRQ